MPRNSSRSLQSPREPSNSNLGESFQTANSWIGTGENSVRTPESYSTPASTSSKEQGPTLGPALRNNTRASDPATSGTACPNGLYELDATTFPFYAFHLLPSEPNGTWRNQFSYAVRSPIKSTPTLLEVLERQLDIPPLFKKLEREVEDRKDDLESLISQTFADFDFAEAHSQQYRDDNHSLAEVVGRKAQRALVEQGICKEWQLKCGGYLKLQNVLHEALLSTFTRTQENYVGMPLFRADPQWVAERDKKVWRLEFDIGKVGVEVGPVTDRSLIELGSIDTGFELPESCGCAPIADIDRRIHIVDDEWHLLEA
ncbi:hypothetical protein E8E12_001660 [Didymella heteroderae]|uniref:Uncharacterized protein n=1 Tax=Didymella heteroderae TaxID=1769908 RepID=A0A9P4WPT7_9PLEO|nr:hypothetical protein E8E12_001660 [Didymella heteroderae]